MENLSNISVVREIMERFGFSFSKSLGQNFLVNPTVCPRIAEQGGAAAEKGVLEIGAGFGVLTHELAKRAGKVVVVELDGRLLPVLQYTLSEHKNVSVVQGDVLKLDLRALLEREFGGMETVVCANLPYYITSPVIMTLLEQRLPVSAITVMVQKEAAERLCAPMPSRACGAVTAAVRYYSDPKALFPVSRGSFMPAPNVDSAVIRLDVKKTGSLTEKEEQLLFKLVRGGFSQRRKTLANALFSAASVPKALAADALQAVGLKASVRAEGLSLADWMVLARFLQQAGVSPGNIQGG